MSEITIKVKDISKEYRIGETNEFRTMRENITKAVSGGMKKLFSGFDRNGNNPRAVKQIEQKENFFWSLKDVSFNVSHGEIVGIVGRNGAGKSTLLKIITGITEPTEGRIDIYGRIASLLEVGTGFHLELTGRENIYLNGAILGMKKREINRKFDEILDFSEVEQFIDTPVKYYSSGMRVRLGFSVAAHLEPEILLIDEVLAVGDAAFQKKCLGKLNNVAASEGRTVLFVSHDMTAILSLCQRAVLLESGQLVAEGSTDEIVQTYMQSLNTTYDTPLEDRLDRYGDKSVMVKSLRMENVESGKPIKSGSNFKIVVEYASDKPVRYPKIIIKIRDFRTRMNIVRLDSEVKSGLPELLPASGKITCVIEDLYVTPGRCAVDIEFIRGITSADRIEHAGYFDVETEDVYGSGKLPTREQSVYLPKYDWEIV
jgi:lipopolysaccharide transport system ATP-binding protein